MPTKNDITGDEIKTKVNSESYRENYDKIFKKQRDIEKEQEFDDKVIMQDEYYDLD